MKIHDFRSLGLGISLINVTPHSDDLRSKSVVRLYSLQEHTDKAMSTLDKPSYLKTTAHDSLNGK